MTSYARLTALGLSVLSSGGVLVLVDSIISEPASLAARAVGPAGMMLEIHPNPEKALSDGPQSLRFGEFAELMRRLFPGG